MDYDTKNITVLLMAPLPPPAGGIATWTTTLLAEAKNYPNIKIQHLDLAVRWRESVNRSHHLQLLGGSIQALRDIMRAGVAMVKIRPHILHLATSAGYSSLKDAVIMLLTRICRKPGVIHYHTSAIASYRHTGGWKLQAALLAMRLAKRVVVLDRETYTFLQKMVPPGKLTKIPNMINVNRIDNLIPQLESTIGKQELGRTKHLVFVGHVIPEKGVVEQVEACAQLANVELHLIGPVTEKFRKQLEHLAQYREGASWLHFYGEVREEEVYRRILVSDILLLPSYAEGFPMALLEGMALSKPAVVSDAGAMAEMIDMDGELECGICVERASTVSLKRGLQRLLDSPESWQRLGQNGRERVETLYSSGSVVRELIKEWEEMTEKHGNG